MTTEMTELNVSMLEFAAQQEREKIKIMDLAKCGKMPVAFLPNSLGRLEAHDLTALMESHADTPKRKQISLTFFDVESFIEYINQQKEATTRIFCTYREQGDCRVIVGFRAVIDFHGNKTDDARWCAHEARLTLTPTSEWQAWNGADKKQFGQLAFAEFLEEHMLDVVNPPAADLMEVVQNLTLKTDVAFRSQVNLDNGDVQFLYENTSQPGGPKGMIEFPTKFELNIPVLEGSDPTPVKARFRYKRIDSVLSFSFYLIQAEKLYRSVVDVMLDKIQNETECTVFKGYGKGGM